MSAPRSLTAFLTDETGAAAAEFAMVSILFLGMMVGTIDVARLLWELNTAKAGTRAATRYAVTSDPAAAALVNYVSPLPGGTPVTDADVATYTCTSSGCTCSGAGACGSTALNTTAFNNIAAVVQAHYGRAGPANVTVEYRPLGVGFAGNPCGPDVEPLVTVKIRDLQFAPGVLQAFGIDPFPMPAVASTLSGEDLSSTAVATPCQ